MTSKKNKELPVIYMVEEDVILFPDKEVFTLNLLKRRIPNKAFDPQTENLILCFDNQKDDKSAAPKRSEPRQKDSGREEKIGILCKIDFRGFSEEEATLELKLLYRIKGIPKSNPPLINSGIAKDMDDFTGCTDKSINELFQSMLSRIKEIKNESTKITAVYMLLFGDISLDLDKKIVKDIKDLLKYPEKQHLWASLLQIFKKYPKTFSMWVDALLNISPTSFNKYRYMCLKEPRVITRLEIFTDKIFPSFIKELEAIGEMPIVTKSHINNQDSNQVKNSKSEIDKFKEKIKKSKMPPEARGEAERELERLKSMTPSTSEYTVSKTYLEWMTSLPWGIYTKDNLNIIHAEKILDKDHAFLEKVKERILEHLAVRKLNPDSKGSILCFVGPPGTGKTSVGKSIARAMGRKFIRISLGSVREEAEIRGHRRTFVGALPGKIISEIRKAKSQNPVFMLDEIDKLCKDYHGDPASALLEVLDSEQNFSFCDNYLGVGFDLSDVLFITTANVLDTIQPALLDRMEIIEFPGYMDFEKLEIAKGYLCKKQIKDKGLDEYDIRFTDNALMKIIRYYTKEAGVRELEQKMGNICRKIAKKITSNNFDDKDKIINEGTINEYLGKPRYSGTELMNMVPGMSNGLFCTGHGGGILPIEVSLLGEDYYEVTGCIEEVMEESIKDALSLLSYKKKELGIEGEKFNEHSGIHIRAKGGSIPKDGPSGGIAITVAIYSEIIQKIVRNDIAFTGEVTLKGFVDPIGGLDEKVLGAKRAGIKTIYLPKDNKIDIEELPGAIKKGIKFKYVSDIMEVLKDKNLWDNKKK